MAVYSWQLNLQLDLFSAFLLGRFSVYLFLRLNPDLFGKEMTCLKCIHSVDSTKTCHFYFTIISSQQSGLMDSDILPNLSINYFLLLLAPFLDSPLLHFSNLPSAVGGQWSAVDLTSLPNFNCFSRLYKINFEKLENILPRKALSDYLCARFKTAINSLKIKKSEYT